MTPLPHSPKARALAFSKMDLLITIGVVALLAGVGAGFFTYSKSFTKINTCAANLRLLGVAVQMYAPQNADKIPYAFIHLNDHNKISWDTLVRPYARAGMRGEDPNQPAPGTNEFKKILLCPDDDTGPRDWGKPQGRRTYSMPWHDMAAANWPPAGTNDTGLGLGWRANGAQGNASLSAVVKQGGILPSIKLAMVLDTSGTLLLAEQSRSNNIIANSSGATIRGIADHVERRDDREPVPYHKAKLNYLMADGHVELLSPQETIGSGVTGTNQYPHHGKWTLNPKD